MNVIRTMGITEKRKKKSSQSYSVGLMEGWCSECCQRRAKLNQYNELLDNKRVYPDELGAMGDQNIL